MQWLPYVMVRITAIWIAGILLGIYKKILGQETATLLFFTLSASYFPIYFLLKRSAAIKIVSGAVGLGAVFIAGYLVVFIRDESCLPDHLLTQDSIIAYRTRVTGFHEEKEKSWKRTTTVISILTNDGWKNASGQINVYWPKSEPCATLDYGDEILIRGSPEPIAPPLNPQEFDFKKFLRFKNIFHQQFVKSGDWKFLFKSRTEGPLFYAQRARTWSVNAIKRNIQAPREQAIVIALVLGVTDGIDNELKNAYTASGAMHALAVSGLHVSIIYGILLFFFKPLGRIPGSTWITALASLGVLWGYAFITGLSPSVLRAVTMFSFMVIGKPFAKTTNIYNTLAASAFCLLVFDPFLIMSVGFQLSYLAVGGIVYLYRPIYRLWEPQSWWMNWTWQITCVSIAAQIATLPLTLFYFHQFPVYFLFSNLFVIPGSFVVLVGGLSLMALSPLDTIANWLGIVLEGFVKIFNDAIFLVEKLPMSLISNLYITSLQCLLLFILILSILVLIQFRKFKILYFITISTSWFAIISWTDFIRNEDECDWTIYALKGHSAMALKERGQALLIADSALMNDPVKFQYHILPDFQSHGIQEILPGRPTPAVHGLKFFSVKKRTVLWVESINVRLPDRVSVDYMVISHQAIRSLKEVKGHVIFEKLIFDGTNSFRYCEKMRNEAKTLNIDCAFVLKDGSFTVKL